MNSIDVIAMFWDVQPDGQDESKRENYAAGKPTLEIHADDALRPVFGKALVNMFEMTKLVSKHLK